MGRVRCIAFFLVLLLLPSAFAASGFVGGTTLQYTGSSSSTAFFYADGVSGNSDLGLESCGFGAGFAGGFYAAFVGGAPTFVPVTYQSATQTLSQVATVSGACVTTANNGLLFVSPSEFLNGGGATPDPEVKKAAFPGRLWIGHDGASGNPGLAIANWDFGDTNAILSGSYSATRTYSEGANTVTVSTPAITFDPTSGSDFSKSASDATFGVSSDKQMVMAVCDDANGEFCDGATIIDDSGDFPAVFTPAFGGAVNDQNTYTKYVVINGLGLEMCIGANLGAAVPSVSPDPVYYSQNLSYTSRVTHTRDTPDENRGGNVDVTTSFDVRVRIYPQGNIGDPRVDTTYTVNAGVPVGTNADQAFIYTANAQSGTYVIQVDTDVNNDIVECDEGDNTATTTFDILPITLPEMLINGVETFEFPYPNAPFNVSMHLKNSDNDTLRNASVIITEENGLSVSAPTQTFTHVIDALNNTRQRGINVTTTASFRTDYNGNFSFTYIPAYNTLYEPLYNNTNLSSILGNYSLTLSGEEEGGQDFVFILSGQVQNQRGFTIANTSYTGPYNTTTIPNDSIVSQVLDFVYHTYSNFIDAVVR